MEKKVGNHQLIKSIGKGGMGEVFLAHDPVCDRDVALKQMLPEWVENETLRKRFIREAQIAAQLSHPSIIPIYSMDPEGTYYTMAHIEGETLKSIIRTTREQSKKGDPLHPVGSSVPALIRIFLSVCGAVAFAHDQGVLHRDLKPENMIVGKYGEVIILDWGLAHLLNHEEVEEGNFEGSGSHLTQPGKIAGTLLYMAPERAFGGASSFQTDIYSLGVVLYQILTLRFPFKRKAMKEYRKMAKFEEIPDPEELAPDREISPHLSTIAQRCLEQKPEDRYESVAELMQDLEDYIEGLPEWIDTASLDPIEKRDWEFQENVALTKHMALTRGIENLEWVNLMISKAHFPGNLRLEMELSLGEGGKGLGILFAAPDTGWKSGIEEGCILWLTSEGVHLFRTGVEVVHNEEIHLETERSYQIRIEKIDDQIRFYLDGKLQFGFLSHIPLHGTGVGLLLRDDNVSLSPLHVFLGSQNILVNCLAVPDAFLARKHYKEALEEYRKISYSFPGRAEGREATFRAGMTLLKEARQKKEKSQKELLYAQAHQEFEKLHHTPGAPLEYLGKSLVYKAEKEIEEEVKSLELALRKFPKHPLKQVLIENIFSRLEELAQNDRLGAFHFALLALRQLPHLPETEKISALLANHLEPLPFFTPSPEKEIYFAIQLAFWLNKPLILEEMVDKGLDEVNQRNGKIALLLLGEGEKGAPLTKETLPELYAHFHLLCKEEEDLSPLAEEGLDAALSLWVALRTSTWEKAEQIIKTLTPDQFESERDPLFFLYGCFLAHAKGEEAALAHLTSISEKAYPPLPSLLSHFLVGRIGLEKGWIERAFPFEKFSLYEQLDLYAHCLGKTSE